MNGNLRGRQPEDQPSATRVNAREFQYIAYEIAVFLGIAAVDD
jgi:hypothetical protein